MEDKKFDLYPCHAHPEFVQATARLMNAVDVLTTNVNWVVNIGKAVFGLGIALIVTIVMAIYSAGELTSKIQVLEAEVAIIQTYMREHELDRNAHHD